MAIETIQLEGDFVLKSSSGNVAFRFHADEDAFTIEASQGRLVMANSEAQELMGWLRRRFDEPTR